MTEEATFTPLQQAVYDHCHRMLNDFPRVQAGDIPAPEQYFSSEFGVENGYVIPEGDFEWKQEEAGDWDAYQCGESDCVVPGGWHKIAGGMDMGRKDGKLWVETWTVDQDGDHDVSSRWDEGDSLVQFQDTILDTITDDHYIGWAEYCLWCAENGTDPLNEAIGPVSRKERVDFWLVGALEKVRYLYMGIQNSVK